MNKINCLNRDILPNIKPFEKKKANKSWVNVEVQIETQHLSNFIYICRLLKKKVFIKLPCNFFH